MGKTLVVYYSFEGNTREIGEAIGKKLGADTLDLKPLKEIPQKGFMKYFWGGKMAVFGEKPPLEKINLNLNSYETIFIGVPVWASKPAPPLNTFLEEFKIENKKVALFCTFDGSMGKTFEVIKENIKGNNFISEKGFKAPSKNIEKAKMEAAEWAAKIVMEK